MKGNLKTRSERVCLASYTSCSDVSWKLREINTSTSFHDHPQSTNPAPLTTYHIRPQHLPLPLSLYSPRKDLISHPRSYTHTPHNPPCHNCPRPTRTQRRLRTSTRAPSHRPRQASTIRLSCRTFSSSDSWSSRTLWVRIRRFVRLWRRCWTRRGGRCGGWLGCEMEMEMETRMGVGLTVLRDGLRVR